MKNLYQRNLNILLAGLQMKKPFHPIIIKQFKAKKIVEMAESAGRSKVATHLFFMANSLNQDRTMTSHNL